ncbi:hypothetical protein PR048_030311 [Dryococelus australis]|uniref:Uncharacterized protein n=1 Tax=Dryococelus australis TaxID=614101 RepID=A0ABQ9GCI6_9NEOP|nr:hypothetical protein PR048_030311 [Dryococelus australis]
MPLVGKSFRESPVSPAFAFRRYSIFTSFQVMIQLLTNINTPDECRSQRIAVVLCCYGILCCDWSGVRCRRYIVIQWSASYSGVPWPGTCIFPVPLWLHRPRVRCVAHCVAKSCRAKIEVGLLCPTYADPGAVDGMPYDAEGSNPNGAVDAVPARQPHSNGDEWLLTRPANVVQGSAGCRISPDVMPRTGAARHNTRASHRTKLSEQHASRPNLQYVCQGWCLLCVSTPAHIASHWRRLTARPTRMAVRRADIRLRAARPCEPQLLEIVCFRTKARHLSCRHLQFSSLTTTTSRSGGVATTRNARVWFLPPERDVNHLTLFMNAQCKILLTIIPFLQTSLGNIVAIPSSSFLKAAIALHYGFYRTVSTAVMTSIVDGGIYNALAMQTNYPDTIKKLGGSLVCEVRNDTKRECQQFMACRAARVGDRYGEVWGWEVGKESMMVAPVFPRQGRGSRGRNGVPGSPQFLEQRGRGCPSPNLEFSCEPGITTSVNQDVRNYNSVLQTKGRQQYPPPPAGNRGQLRDDIGRCKAGPDIFPRPTSSQGRSRHGRVCALPPPSDDRIDTASGIKNKEGTFRLRYKEKWRGDISAANDVWGGAGAQGRCGRGAPKRARRPAGNRAQFVLVGGERSYHYTTAAPVAGMRNKSYKLNRCNNLVSWYLLSAVHTRRTQQEPATRVEPGETEFIAATHERAARHPLHSCCDGKSTTMFKWQITCRGDVWVTLNIEALRANEGEER